MTTSPTRTVLIAYDVNKAAEAQPALAEAIMSLGDSWARPLDTVWVLRTTRTAADIEDCLAVLLGDEDGLMVQETRGEARLVNAGLRWFKPRVQAATETRMPPSIVAFRQREAGELERAA